MKTSNAEVSTAAGVRHSLHETMEQAESAAAAANGRAVELGLSVTYIASELAVPVAG